MFLAIAKEVIKLNFADATRRNKKHLLQSPEDVLKNLKDGLCVKEQTSTS